MINYNNKHNAVNAILHMILITKKDKRKVKNMFAGHGTTPIMGTSKMGKNFSAPNGKEQKKGSVSTKSQGKIIPSHKCGKQGTASKGDVTKA